MEGEEREQGGPWRQPSGWMEREISLYLTLSQDAHLMAWAFLRPDSGVYLSQGL